MGNNMSKKSLKLLRIGALVLGWILLITISLDSWGSIYRYLHIPVNTEGVVSTMAKFAYLRAHGSLFSGLGSVFFAFLVAAILRMIEKEAPVGMKKAQRLMIVCCFFYLADAIVRFFFLIMSLPHITNCFNRPNWISLLPHAYIGPPPFAPFLYAASIFVLFTHFTKMVTFESEVA